MKWRYVPVVMFTSRLTSVRKVTATEAMSSNLLRWFSVVGEHVCMYVCLYVIEIVERRVVVSMFMVWEGTENGIREG